MIAIGVIKAFLVLTFFVMGCTKREKKGYENPLYSYPDTNTGWSIGSVFCFPVDALFLFFCYIIRGRLEDVELWYLILSLLLQAALVYGERLIIEMHYRVKCDEYIADCKRTCERRKEIERSIIEEKEFHRSLPQNASTVLEKEDEYKVVRLADTGEYMVYRNMKLPTISK